jgi:signal transduction histidine kinase/CheY-like chemotaxis protein
MQVEQHASGKRRLGAWLSYIIRFFHSDFIVGAYLFTSSLIIIALLVSAQANGLLGGTLSALLLAGYGLLMLLFLGLVTWLRRTLRQTFRARITRLTQALALAEMQVAQLDTAQHHMTEQLNQEIAQPIKRILATAELLNQHACNDREREHAYLVATSANALLRALSGIIDHSQLATGRLQLAARRFDLFALLDQVYSSLRPQLQTRLRVRFSVIYAPQLYRYFIGDGERLLQVIEHLVDNALRFTERGFVELQVCSVLLYEGVETLVFSVRDSGIGIAPAKLASLFAIKGREVHEDEREHHQHIDELMLSYQLVRLMQGELSVNSVVGEGSTFTLSVPLPRALQARMQHLVGRSDLALTKLVGLPVLLVETSKLNRFVMKQMLEQLHMQVYTAENGVDSLQLTLQHKFALIYMQLSDAEGCFATQILRNGDAINCNTPIIALLAEPAPTDQDYCKHEPCGGTA